jgi:ribosome maturation factor RimP
MASETVEKVREIIEPVLLDLGFELVEIQLRRERVGLVLRLIIYKDGGIALDDCTRVSREVGYLLEVDDPINSPYTLEVSSPGLDRPLVTARDFARYKGEEITVVFDDAGEKKTAAGTIQSVEDELFLHLNTKEGDLRIELAKIDKARLVIEF